MMDFHIRESGSYKIIELQDYIRDDHAQELKKILVPMIRSGCKLLVLDLTKVVYLSSHALGIFVAAWKEMTRISGSIHIIMSNPRIREILESANLHTLIRIFCSEAEFLKATSGKGEKSTETIVREKGKYKILDVTEPMNIFCGFRELDEQIQRLVSQGHLHIALNVEEIIHLYSEVISVFIKWKKKLELSGGSLCLVNLSEDLKSRLEYLDLRFLLGSCKTEEDLNHS